jgi:hypothetical protein
MSTQLLNQVTRFLSENLDARLTYHNAAHTVDVYYAAQQIGKTEGLNEDDMKVLLIAAAYHDSGFVSGHKGHEEASTRICFEQVPNLSNDEQVQIEAIILATKPFTQPTTQLEKIIKDADLDYLGRDDFMEIADRLFQENVAFGLVSSREQWNHMQITFMTMHQFYTDYSKAHREPKKAANLALIKRNAGL